MEHAIWIKKTGVEEYIHIQKIKTALGEAYARREKYKCPSKNCGVKMITVFPKQIRRGGKEAHSDHFRARRPDRHTPNCGGDGEREAGVGVSTGEEIYTKPRYDVVQGGIYPMHYVKRSRAQRDIIDSVIDDGEDLGTQEPKVERIRHVTHTSEPETGHIRGIVEAYENPPDLLSRMKLTLPGCPARNYKDAFVDIDQVLNKSAILGGYYIYKGAYSDHQVYANNGITITFSSVCSNNRNLGIWIKPELEPQGKREEIKRLLWRARRDRNATVYVFGRFQPFNSRKYSVEIEALGDLWITFSGKSNTET